MEKIKSAFGNRKIPWIIGGFLIVSLLLETAFIGFLMVNSQKKDVLGTSTQIASPSSAPFIDCFVGGEAIKATRETCQELSKQAVHTPASTLSPTAIPVVKNAPTAQPERKKVTVAIDDSGGITKGNFLCYEDKVNYLANLQNEIRMKDNSERNCTLLSQNEGTTCSNNNCHLNSNSDEDVKVFDACSQKCYSDASAKCENGVGDLRRQLASDVQQYCPN